MFAAVEAGRRHGKLLPGDVGKSQEEPCLLVSVNELGGSAGVCASAKCTNRPVWTAAAQPSRTAAFFAFFKLPRSTWTASLAPIILSHLIPRSAPVASDRALLSRLHQAQRDPKPKPRHFIILQRPAPSADPRLRAPFLLLRLTYRPLMPLARHVSTQRPSLPPHHQ